MGVFTARLLLLGASLFTATAGVSENTGKSLAQHFAALVAAKAHESSATAAAIPLPAAAAGAILHFDDALLTGAATEREREASFAAVLAHETALRATAAPGAAFPYVLCGPQTASVAARTALTASTGSDRHPVSQQRFCIRPREPIYCISVYNAI
jgi:hypothetical protein